jgi:hypothetical protein
MKALKDPVRESYGMCYSARPTDEFEKLIETAKDKIAPFSIEEVSRIKVYFKIEDEEVSSEFDCCDNDECIIEAKEAVRGRYGQEADIEECYYDNDGDHENIETCSVCCKPLNEYLTWCESELEYLEENKPWDAQFLKDQGFLINCILNSTPSMDCDISRYSQCQGGEILQEALKEREDFFQRIGELALAINKII